MVPLEKAINTHKITTNHADAFSPKITLSDGIISLNVNIRGATQSERYPEILIGSTSRIRSPICKLLSSPYNAINLIKPFVVSLLFSRSENGVRFGMTSYE
eukprot:808316_1